MMIDRSRRLVNLAPDALALLAGLKIKQREQAEALEIGWSESEYVFCHADESPFYPNTVSKRPSELVKKSGVPKLRLHDMRQTHASLMLKEGANPKTVAERLGHASVVITLDTYSHVLPGGKRGGRNTGRLAPISYLKWRREWDSNPRYPYGYTGFRDRRLRPLGHLSGANIISDFGLFPPSGALGI